MGVVCNKIKSLFTYCWDKNSIDNLSWWFVVLLSLLVGPCPVRRVIGVHIIHIGVLKRFLDVVHYLLLTMESSTPCHGNLVQ